MTASFACDPAEMTRLKGRHNTPLGSHEHSCSLDGESHQHDKTLHIG